MCKKSVPLFRIYLWLVAKEDDIYSDSESDEEHGNDDGDDDDDDDDK